MTDRHDLKEKHEPSDVPSDLLHDSGEAGGDPDAHAPAPGDAQPAAADDDQDTAIGHGTRKAPVPLNSETTAGRTHASGVASS